MSCTKKSQSKTTTHKKLDSAKYTYFMRIQHQNNSNIMKYLKKLNYRIMEISLKNKNTKSLNSKKVIIGQNINVN